MLLEVLLKFLFHSANPQYKTKLRRGVFTMRVLITMPLLELVLIYCHVYPSGQSLQNYKSIYNNHIYITVFFLSNKKTGDRRLDGLSSPETPWVVMATTYDATGGVWGRWLCGLQFSLVISARWTCHSHPSYLDSHITEMYTLYPGSIKLEWFRYYHINRLLNLKAGSRRFDGFGAAGGTMSCHYDNLRCHRWRRDTLYPGSIKLEWFRYYHINRLLNLKAGNRRFDSFGAAGGTMSCHYDNLRCHRWRPDTLYPGSIKLEWFRYYHINRLLNLKAGNRRFDGFGAAGGTMSCHNDNLRCHRWRRACRSDDPLFPRLDVPV